MKTGLIMEGGAMRGLFTAGVIDVLMENDITFDLAIGVSAGAVFGCNIKSKQIGRVLRYNVRFSKNWRFCSFRSLLLTGDLFGRKFCYEEIPDRLDIFDRETFRNNPMQFYAVCTDANTGETIYHLCEKGSGEDMEWFRASASMPLVSKPVKVKGYELLDGGITDSIPLRAAQKLGADKSVVILTQPEDYVKKENSAMPLIRRILRKYPKTVEAMENRHIVYNRQKAYVRKCRAAGTAFVIQPEESLGIGHTESDPNELCRVYELGRAAAEKSLPQLKEFLSGDREEAE